MEIFSAGGHLKEGAWDAIHPSIVNTSKAIAEAGKYDNAIFEAFKYVEGEVQERINSSAIGIALLNLAFDGASPKIRISDESRDQEGFKKLFEGALTNIRNDRGHKKAPSLPCENITVCLQYLAFASLLLYLLSKDRNAYPQIQSVRVFGSSDNPLVEINGSNFTSSAQMIAAGQSIPIVHQKSDLIEAELPAGFSGEVGVNDEGRQSNKVYCDVILLESRAENRYEIIRAEIPIYADSKCTQRRKNVVGILIRATEAGRDFLRLTPTHKGKYRRGCYITHGPFTKKLLGKVGIEIMSPTKLNLPGRAQALLALTY